MSRRGGGDAGVAFDGVDERLETERVPELPERVRRGGGNAGVTLDGVAERIETERVPEHVRRGSWEHRDAVGWHR
jgi:hypothetical protein